MSFRVLNSIGSNFREWTMWVDRLPGEFRDIHFLPAYGRIYEKTYGFTPLLFLMVEKDAFVLQSVVKRRLNDLPFLTDSNEAADYFDIANPYGYGGPIASTLDQARARDLFQKFDTACRKFCISEKIASEFISFHPLLDNHLAFHAARKGNPQKQKKIVYVDLTNEADEIWRNVNRGHRSSISKARKNNIIVERIEPDDDAIDLFNRIYKQTMKRNRAASRWFFPEDYFANCRDCLGSENVSLHVARKDGNILSMYFLMHAFETVYYHFGASDERYFELRPNNLLMYETILWAREKGFKTFHLGGGVSSDDEDSLLRYKRGFSKQFKMLYTLGRVHEKNTYDVLCRLKADHETRTRGRLSESDYFPAYRRS